jgi:hypothetical protein
MLLVVVLVCGWASTARAESDVLAWLESLSGPGPFHQYWPAFDVRTYCAGYVGTLAGASNKKKAEACYLRDDEDNIKFLLKLGVASGETGTQQVFQDDPTDVRNILMRTFEVAGMYRANRVIDVGGGLWFMRLSDANESFSTWRVGLVPARVDFAPLAAVKYAPIRRMVKISVEGAWLPNHIVGKDLGNSRTTFDSRREVITRVSIQFEVLATAYRIAKP